MTIDKKFNDYWKIAHEILADNSFNIINLQICISITKKNKDERQLKINHFELIRKIMSSKNLLNLASTSVGIIIITASLLFYYKRRRYAAGRAQTVPNMSESECKFAKVGKVEQLFVYPIKSGKGIQVSLKELLK